MGLCMCPLSVRVDKYCSVCKDDPSVCEGQRDSPPKTQKPVDRNRNETRLSIYRELRGSYDKGDALVFPKKKMLQLFAGQRTRIKNA